MFDAQRFLEDNNIDIPARNANCNDGWVNCQCPHCDDRSNHLGFNLATGQVHCWRCGASDLIDTIKALCNCSTKQAFEIKKQYSIILSDDEYEKPIYHNTEIEVPGSKLLKQHKRYLESRNFDPDFLENKYDLRGTLIAGLFSYRIITPIYYNNKIVSYQGRDFTNKQDLRYITCKPEHEIMHHKNILFNLDNCKNKSVIVVEGVYDSFRIGDNSCSTFGISYKQEQVALLAKKFDRIFTLFDGEQQAQEQAIKLCRDLALVGKEAINVCLDEGDPADQSEQDIYELKKDLRLL